MTVDDILRSGAIYGLDQRLEYDCLESALDSAYGNARDTIIEAGFRDALEGDTFPIFRSYVQARAAKIGVSLVGTSCAVEAA